MSAPMPLRAQLAHDGIVQVAAQGLPARALFAEVARRLRPVVPSAAAGWLSTDPASLLFTDAYVEGSPPTRTRSSSRTS